MCTRVCLSLFMKCVCGKKFREYLVLKGREIIDYFDELRKKKVVGIKERDCI